MCMCLCDSFIFVVVSLVDLRVFCRTLPNYLRILLSAEVIIVVAKRDGNFHKISIMRHSYIFQVRGYTFIFVRDDVPYLKYLDVII